MAAAVGGLFSDTRPRDRALTLLIASVITAAICVPLLLAALDSRKEATASAEGIVAITDDGTIPLAGAAIGPDADAFVRVEGDNVGAVAWALFDQNAAQVGESQVRTPPFDLNLTLADLEPGSYDLYITITTRAGGVVERLASFAVLAE